MEREKYPFSNKSQHSLLYITSTYNSTHHEEFRTYQSEGLDSNIFAYLVTGIAIHSKVHAFEVIYRVLKVVIIGGVKRIWNMVSLIISTSIQVKPYTFKTIH